MRTARFLSGVCFLCGLAVTAPVYASSLVTQWNVNIGRVGMQQNEAYFSITTPLQLNCQWNDIYIDIGNDTNGEWGRSMLSELLAAKLAKEPLPRIDYYQDSTGACWLNLVEIAD